MRSYSKQGLGQLKQGKSSIVYSSPPKYFNTAEKKPILTNSQHGMASTLCNSVSSTYRGTTVVDQQHVMCAEYCMCKCPHIRPLSPFDVENTNYFRVCTQKSHNRQEQLRCELLKQREEKISLQRQLLDREQELRTKQRLIQEMQTNLSIMQGNFDRQSLLIGQLPELIAKSIETNMKRYQIKSQSRTRTEASIDAGQTGVAEGEIRLSSRVEEAMQNFKQHEEAVDLDMIQEVASQALRDIQQHIMRSA